MGIFGGGEKGRVFPDPLTMNSSTTTSSPGRWSPPASKAQGFLSNSNSFGGFGAGMCH